MLRVVGAVGRGLEAQSGRVSSGDLSVLRWLEQGTGGGTDGAGEGGAEGARIMEGLGSWRALGVPALLRTPRCGGVHGFPSEGGNGEEMM